MHLDTVVARHYNLQKSASRARKAVNDALAEQQRVVAIKSPAGFPPLERVVDVRIPMHFSSVDLQRTARGRDRTPFEDFRSEAEALFSSLDVPLHATLHLCRAETYAGASASSDAARRPQETGARFLAVCGKENMMTRWKDVHEPLKAMVRRYYCDWDDPAIRYFGNQATDAPYRP